MVSSEGERWWMGAVTYVGGGLAAVVVGGLAILFLIEDAWILLIGVAVIFGLVAFLWAIIEGHWP